MNKGWSFIELPGQMLINPNAIKKSYDSITMSFMKFMENKMPARVKKYRDSYSLYVNESLFNKVIVVYLGMHIDYLRDPQKEWKGNLYNIPIKIDNSLHKDQLVFNYEGNKIVYNCIDEMVSSDTMSLEDTLKLLKIKSEL